MTTTNYLVKNPTLKSQTSDKIEPAMVQASNEVYAVIEAEKIWKKNGYIFHPEMSVATVRSAGFNIAS